MGKKKRGAGFFTVLLADLALFVAVFLLMGHAKRLLESDVRISLAEIATQNRELIAGNLNMEMNNLNLASKQLAEMLQTEEAATQDEMDRMFLEYCREQGEEQMLWASGDGIAMYADGTPLDVGGRHYFRLAMRGIPNISERIVSRVTGDDIFMISVPIRSDEKVIGVVAKAYTTDELYQLCSLSLFAGEGSSYIINSQGYLVISAQNDKYNRESDNYYRIIYMDNPKEAKQLEEDIQSNRSGFMEITLDGEKQFCAYAPVGDVYDWYLISAVSQNAVSPNGTAVIKLFYAVLLMVVLFFSCLMFFFLRLKKRQQLDMERVAFVDPVTGGNTFSKFEFDVKRILAQHPNDSFAIFFFDIDNFKYINSYYGFDFGDNILKMLYEHYDKQRYTKELLCRINGDHFVMLVEDASQERLGQLFSVEFSVEDTLIYLSSGLYMIEDKSENINLMVDKAELAASKSKGMRYKHVAVYSRSDDEDLNRDEQMKRAVEEAIAADEIIPFFQPKVDIYNRKLVGAEALARWKKKDGTLVPPGAFIPICEQTGMIVTLDMIIFEKTLRFIRKNLDRGIACVPISVNFSRVHLFNKDFVNNLMEKLEEYRIPPYLIEVELTETVFLEDNQFMNGFVDRLKSNGLTLSMDDFGSGYSSLHMLKDVPINVLKIDRGLLPMDREDKRQKIVFGSVAQMAKKLELSVVVEGVETIENVELMKEFGCDVAQGFYFSRPVDSDRFQEFLEKGAV